MDGAGNGTPFSSIFLRIYRPEIRDCQKIRSSDIQSRREYWLVRTRGRVERNTGRPERYPELLRPGEQDEIGRHTGRKGSRD